MVRALTLARRAGRFFSAGFHRDSAERHFLAGGHSREESKRRIFEFVAHGHREKASVSNATTSADA